MIKKLLMLLMKKQKLIKRKIFHFQRNIQKMKILNTNMKMKTRKSMESVLQINFRKIKKKKNLIFLLNQIQRIKQMKKIKK